MENVQNNYCVYSIKNETGEIAYVGSGRPDRPYNYSAGRTKDFKEFIRQNNITVEILADKLDKETSLISEKEYIEILKPFLNKIKGSSSLPVEYEYLSGFLTYSEDSQTGLKWIKNIITKPSNRSDYISTKIGDIAGNIGKNNKYGSVCINYKRYALHRVIWCLYNKKDIPSGMIVNHKDSDIYNNHPSNLELCTQQKNIQSSKRKPQGSVGHIGICKVTVKCFEYYYAYIRVFSKYYRKYFSIKKYGDQEALTTAIFWRNNKLKELGRNANG